MTGALYEGGMAQNSDWSGSGECVWVHVCVWVRVFVCMAWQTSDEGMSCPSDSLTHIHIQQQ